MRKAKRGKIVILSAPSGAGKTTICEIIKKKAPDIVFSISATTRKPRKGEVNGRHYYFLSKQDFKEKIKAHYFIEWAQVHNHYYGTPWKNVDVCWKENKTCIFSIDVQGAMNIKKEYPEAITIFIVPPSLKELEKRLKERRTDSEKEVKIRLHNAEKELLYKEKYDYVIVNDQVERAAKKVLDIIK